MGLGFVLIPAAWGGIYVLCTHLLPVREAPKGTVSRPPVAVGRARGCGAGPAALLRDGAATPLACMMQVVGCYSFKLPESGVMGMHRVVQNIEAVRTVSRERFRRMGWPMSTPIPTPPATCCVFRPWVEVTAHHIQPHVHTAAHMCMHVHASRRTWWSASLALTAGWPLLWRGW